MVNGAIPRREVGFRQLENPKATILILFVAVFVVQFFDDPADTLFGDVCNGREISAVGRFGKLNQDEFTVAAILLVKVEDGMGRGAGAGEEVEDDIFNVRSMPYQLNQ